ncbi:MAG: glycosyltransferase family 2 protein [Coraliomargarita sp.]
METPIATIAFVPREVFCQTKDALETLFQRTDSPFELVCIDGNSPPEVRAYLETAAKEKGFTLIRTDSYLSPNQARNIAIRWAQKNARSPYIVFVDNDVFVGDGWLAPLVECAQETGAWVVGPAYYEHLPERSKLHMFGGTCRVETDDSGARRLIERHDFAHLKAQDLSEALTRRETELIEFHVVLVRLAAFDTLVELDEGLLSQSEHCDLCLMVREAGHSIWLEPASQITYVPPKKLQGPDKEYFFLRWSETWNEASLQRLENKWSLTPIDRENSEITKFVRTHRRLGLNYMRTIRKLIGRKKTKSIEKRFIIPNEPAWNSKRFPYEKYCKVAPVNESIVYSHLE